MAMKAIRTVGKAAGERALGLGPGPIRAAVAAAITGAATAALTYKALRSDKLGAGSED
jgi:hypothetical protein